MTKYRIYGTFSAERYKVIPTRGADLLYDTETNTYYKQFRLPFVEWKESDERVPKPRAVE